ncbi:MAG: Holliday junction branch migration protein RuvA [bacterium]|nr:Holliday junction branch migration protein RuvA [bacterium]
MIAWLQGSVKLKTEKYLILSAAAVGYKVFVTPGHIADAKIGQTVEFFIHHYVSENTNELYGFAMREELDLFESLINVSGVGPKSALGIISMAPVREIEQAILGDDPGVMTKVSGIGRKTAERIIVELKGTLEKKGVISEGGDQGFADVLDALIQLGYTKSDARQALNTVTKKHTDTQERLKAALALLGKG